jgi:hypothetical protein
MRPISSNLACYPFALAIRCSDLAIQTRRQLDVHKRPARTHEVQKLLVLLLEVGIVEDLDLDTRLA